MVIPLVQYYSTSIALHVMQYYSTSIAPHVMQYYSTSIALHVMQYYSTSIAPHVMQYYSASIAPHVMQYRAQSFNLGTTIHTNIIGSVGTTESRDPCDTSLLQAPLLIMASRLAQYWPSLLPLCQGDNSI